MNNCVFTLVGGGKDTTAMQNSLYRILNYFAVDVLPTDPLEEMIERVLEVPVIEEQTYAFDAAMEESIRCEYGRIKWGDKGNLGETVQSIDRLHRMVTIVVTITYADDMLLDPLQIASTIPWERTDTAATITRTVVEDSGSTTVETTGIGTIELRYSMPYTVHEGEFLTRYSLQEILDETYIYCDGDDFVSADVTLQCIGSNGETFMAEGASRFNICGAIWSELETYTWGDLEGKTWTEIEHLTAKT